MKLNRFRVKSAYYAECPVVYAGGVAENIISGTLKRHGLFEIKADRIYHENGDISVQCLSLSEAIASAYAHESATAVPEPAAAEVVANCSRCKHFEGDGAGVRMPSGGDGWCLRRVVGHDRPSAKYEFRRRTSAGAWCEFWTPAWMGRNVK